MLKYGVLICLLSVFTVGLASCQTTDDKPIENLLSSNQVKTLRVGVATDLPPLIFKQNGQFTGIEADFARLLAEELNRKCLFVELQWEHLIPALMSDRVDIIMSGLSVTPSRRLRIDFTEPYLGFGQMILMRRDDINKYPALISILESESRIGVGRNTTGETFVQQNCPRARCVAYATVNDAAIDLMRRRIDFFVVDAPCVWWLASVHESDLIVYPSSPLTEEYLAWGVNRSNQDLLRDANRVMTKWKNDGTRDRIIKYWLPANAATSSASK